MIEIQGETEFLTRVITRHGNPEHQKTILELRTAEANDAVVCRAIRRVSWILVGVILVYWAGSAIAFFMPAVLLKLSGKILGVLCIAAGISFLAFSAYRAYLRQHLRCEIEKCRRILESALDAALSFSGTIQLQEDSTGEHCARCRREILTSRSLSESTRFLPLPSSKRLAEVDSERPSYRRAALYSGSGRNAT